MRFFLVSIFCVCLSNASFGQELSYAYIDSLSYLLYTKKAYKELENIGEKAISQEIDFYYLRMRVGGAYYEQQKYAKALEHFKVAREMNPNDTLAQEYLYYSLLLAGYKEDALISAKDLREEVKKKINYKNKKFRFEQISLTTGLLIGQDLEENKSKDFKSAALYAENTLQGNTSFFNLFLENRINNRWLLSNNFSFYNIESMSLIQKNNASTATQSFQNANYGYNLGISYFSPKNFITSLHIGYFQENADFLFLRSDPLSPQAPLYATAVYQHNAYTAMLQFSKKLTHTTWGISGAFGSLGNTNQMQVGAYLLAYPFQTRKFYFLSSYTLLQNDENLGGIFSQKIGGNFGKSIFYEFWLSTGNHQNFISHNLSYNTAEPILLIAGGQVGFRVKQFYIFPSYEIQERESSYTRYISPIDSQIIKNTYFNQLFKCTLQWKF
ncbi:MAG: hypothetical protein SFU27_08870 [Thermonemataceae bacterium]|nr:hypothetical protein [Thermonemataceae bacterium]